MDINEQLQSLLRSHLGALSATPSGWHKTNCPVCALRGHRPDRRQRFGVKFDSDSTGTNCFNCGFHASWSTGSELSSAWRTLLSTVGVSHTDIDRLVFEAYVNKHQVATDRHRNSLSVTTQWPTVSLPEGAHSIQHWLEQPDPDPQCVAVAQYAVSRGIDDLSRVAWAPSGPQHMNRRMIVPFEWQGRTVGYTARHTAPGAPHRYTQQVPANYVFNLDAQRDYDRCYTIVTEGAIDALLVDGVSVQHNRVSAGQAQLINSLHTLPIVCADRDHAGSGLVEAALQHGWAVSFPPWEPQIKDAGDAVQAYGRLYTVYSIINSRTQDADKIRLWQKLEESQRAARAVHT